MPRVLRSAVAVVLAASVAMAARAGADPRADIRQLALDTEVLRKMVALASGEEFYVVLDPNARTITLMLKGATLRHYEVQAIELADPQVAFVSRGDAHDWQGRIWSRGSLVPTREQDRVEIKVPPPGAEETEQEAVIPPTPEEKYPVPPRFGIRYEGGLFVEIRSEGDDAPHQTFRHRLAAWWEDFKEALRPHPTDRIRLRLTLELADVEAIYRSLPPDTKLLALPPR